MRRLLTLTAVALAGCGDGPAAPDPGESPLAEAALEPLVLATRDATDRVLPALATELPAPRAHEVGRALAELEGALDSRLPGRLQAAAAGLRATLASEVEAGGAEAPDADALDLLATAVRLVAERSIGGAS